MGEMQALAPQRACVNEKNGCNELSPGGRLCYKCLAEKGNTLRVKKFKEERLRLSLRCPSCNARYTYGGQLIN